MKKTITTEQVQELQSMINKNCSFIEIGEVLNVSGKTVQRMCKRYNIDLSSYDRKKARGKRRRKDLTKDDIDNMKKLFISGAGLGDVANHFGMSRPTLMDRIHTQNINIDEYKKPGSRTTVFTKEEEEKFISLIKSGVMVKDIAKEFKVNRNTIKFIAERFGYPIKKNVKDKNYKIDIIRRYSNILSSYEISLCLGTFKTVVEDLAAKNKISLDVADVLSRDEKRYAISKCIFDAESSRQGLRTHRNFISYNLATLFSTLLKTYPFETICSNYNKNYRAVKRAMIAFGLSKAYEYSSILESSYSKEFEDDMRNVLVNLSWISMKYGPSAESLKEKRESIYFAKYKTGSNIRKSIAEITMEEIFHSIDIAFFSQYHIQRYKVDYYIGQKIIIEVQGDYWHSEKCLERRSERKEQSPIQKDMKKKKFLIQKGYTCLYFKEKDIMENQGYVVSEILKNYKVNLLKNVKPG